MPTAEGSGRAKRALEEAFGGAVTPPPFDPKSVVSKLAGRVAAHRIEELLGFWVLWQTSGGFEGLQLRFGMSESTIFRRVSLFRELFGAHPDEFDLPGVTIDLEKYWAEDVLGGSAKGF